MGEDRDGRGWGEGEERERIVWLGWRRGGEDNSNLIFASSYITKTEESEHNVLANKLGKIGLTRVLGKSYILCETSRADIQEFSFSSTIFRSEKVSYYESIGPR